MKIHFALAVLASTAALTTVNALERTVALPYDYSNSVNKVYVPNCTPSQYVGVSGTAMVCRDFPKSSDTPVAKPENNVVYHNTSGSKLVVIAACNSTLAVKDLEGWIGASPANLTMTATESGTDRSSITFVVPRDYYYKFRFDVVPGVGCGATAWDGL
jgi:hypothetical protein